MDVSSRSLDTCPVHNEPLSYYCFKDKQTFCSSCIPNHPLHEFLEIPKIISERYSKIEFIAKGGFGSVFKVISKNDATIVQAVKIIVHKITESQTDNPTVKEAQKEFEMMSKLKHENLMNANEILFEEDNDFNLKIIIIMDFCEKNLRDYIRNPRSMEENNPEDFIKEIIYALYYMHKERIIHRDLKPENIFLKKENKKFVVKVGDFGISKAININQNTYTSHENIGTLLYMSPEALRGLKYDRKTDVWACGIIFYEILYGVHPFQVPNQEKKSKIVREEIVERIKKWEKPFFSPEFKHCPFKILIENCLNFDLKERYSAEDMVNFIESYKNGNLTNIEAKTVDEEEKTEKKEKNIAIDIDDEFVSIKSGGKFSSTSRNYVRDLKIEQKDFAELGGERFQLKLQESKSLKDTLKTISDFKYLQIIRVELTECIYNNGYLDNLIFQMRGLTNLEKFNLKLNNRIVFVETKPGQCILYWVLVMISVGLAYFLGKRSPCSCSGFYTTFESSLNYSNESDQFIDDAKFKKLCDGIANLKKLKELALDLSYNNITTDGLLVGLNILKKNMTQTTIELKLKPQIDYYDPQNLQDIKDHVLKGWGRIKTDLDEFI